MLGAVFLLVEFFFIEITVKLCERLERLCKAENTVMQVFFFYIFFFKIISLSFILFILSKRDFERSNLLLHLPKKKKIITYYP